MSASRPLTAAAVLLTLVANAAGAQGRTDGADRSLEIRAQEQRLAEAMHAKNRQPLEQLLAPEYVLRGAPDVDRQTWIDNAVTRCWGDRSDIAAFRIRELADVVIASFELTFYVDPATCRPAVLRSLITDVWTRDEDGWQLQVRHSGPAPAPDAGIAAQYGIVPQPPPAWQASAELSLVATGGNTSTHTVGLGGNATHRSGTAVTRGELAFITSNTDDVTQARALTVQLRHGFRVAERIELFGRGTYASDRFAGIADRAVAEAGAAHTTMLPGRQALTVEGSAGFTVERRLDAAKFDFVTATGAVKYVWNLAPGTELVQDLAVIGDVERARDWRGTSTTAVNVGLTRLLSLKAAHALEYRNTAVAGFGRTDMRTTAALVFAFERGAASP
jgi:putative salt-induced outer membrane protein YdiY